MSESKGCSVVAVVMVAILMLVIGVAAGGGAVWVTYVKDAPPVDTPPVDDVPPPETKPEPTVERYAALLPLEDTLRIEGPLPPESVRDLVLGGKRFKLRACYQAGVDRNPTLKGEMSLQFTVAGSNGKVTAAIERHTQFADTKVRDCILNEVKSWTFPESKGSKQSVVKFDVLMMSMTGSDAQ